MKINNVRTAIYNSAIIQLLGNIDNIVNNSDSVKYNNFN